MIEAHAQLRDWNDRFAIAGVVEIVEGRGGWPKLKVSITGATAEIYRHGAQVTSWKPRGAEDVFFLSEASSFQPGKAIRGGVPICFPWFRNKADDSSAPSHGFVRTRAWELADVSRTGESVTITLATQTDEASRAWWPHDLKIAHSITIGESLRMELLVTNTGSSAFHFEEALHSYHRVSDARKVRIAGLDAVQYQDNVDGNRTKTQTGDVRLQGPTDNAYLNTTHALRLIDPGWKRQIVIEKENSHSTVVWNPWIEGAKALSDLGDQEWTQMTCVEACNIRGAAVKLLPGDEHRMSAIISVESL